MTSISTLVKERIFWWLPFTLMSLGIACSRNLPPAAQNKSPAPPAKNYSWSDRQLTPDELTQSLSQLDQDIDKARNSQLQGGLYKDRRTPQKKQEINAYIQSWASIDPNIAPFLGKRRIINHSYIYPSLKKGKVCILRNHRESAASDFFVLFSLGTVKNGILQSSSNETIIVRDGLLAELAIRKNKPQFALLPHALPLQTPDFTGVHPDIQKQFVASKCQFKAPS